jgi:hypothetical protein
MAARWTRRHLVLWILAAGAVDTAVLILIAELISRPGQSGKAVNSLILASLVPLVLSVAFPVAGYLVEERDKAARRAEPAYRATVREIHQRTKILTGRQQELAAIAGFATGPDGYRWLAGEVWAGKTALLAEAVLAPPGNVDVIAYFASRREADADSSRFVEAVVPQLAWLLREDRPSGVREQFRALWHRAADRAERRDRHLLLIVDGLDEDVRPPGLPSIAAELPARAAGHAHVLVSSRLRYQLPPDVPPGHPLMRTRPHMLAPFAGARELAVLARQEIDDLLRRDDEGLAVDVLGLLAAAAGPLAVQDLASMTIVAGRPPVLRRRIRRLLTVSGARSFQATSPAGPRGTERYQFAHESLLEYAQAHEDLNEPDFRHRIDQWADRWRAAGWPTPPGGENGTPQYLLDAYSSALTDDPRRLSELTGDITWAVAAIASVGVDRVLASLRMAAAVDPGNTTVAALLATVTGQALNLHPHRLWTTRATSCASCGCRQPNLVPTACSPRSGSPTTSADAFNRCPGRTWCPAGQPERPARPCLVSWAVTTVSSGLWGCWPTGG